MATRRLGIDEVTARLGVKRATVYAYVSRGLLHSEPGADGRSSTFAEHEVEALAARGRPRRRVRQGEGIDVALASSVTELGDGVVRYRDVPIEQLAGRHSFEVVSELLWTAVPVAGRHSPVVWAADAQAEGAARAALDVLHPAATIGDRLRTAVVAASAADPLRHDLRPEAVVATGRGLIAAVTAALAPPEPHPRPVAARVTDAIDARLAARWRGPVETALVLMADHELATSTLAARIAASTRADPTQVVLAGLATVSGPLHGSASVDVHRLLIDAEADAMGAVVERLRRGRLPGFGHIVHRHGDPRAALLLTDVRTTAGSTGRAASRLAELDRVLATITERAPLAANIDLALGALAYVAAMPLGSTELIFSVARMAGWLAHGLEEYGEEPLRFRARARHREPPRAAATPPDTGIA